MLTSAMRRYALPSGSGRMLLFSGLALLLLLIAPSAPVAASAVRPPNARSVEQFDWALYESWTNAHHRPGIRLTRFAWPWMGHRRMCGGAVTGEVFNPRTLSRIQDFDRCWAVWNPVVGGFHFSRYVDAPPGSTTGS